MIDVPIIYEEFSEWLVEHLSPEVILGFKASPEAQARAHELHDKNNAGTLTEAEREELERVVEIERMFMVLKAHALKKTQRS